MLANKLASMGALGGVLGYLIATASGCAQTGVCGNGFLEAGEECDDGNLEEGDRCPNSCRVEPPPDEPDPGVDGPDAGKSLPGDDAAPTFAATINEFVFNHSSEDVSEYAELYGAPTTDYSHMSFVLLEGDSGTQAGVIDAVIPVGTTDGGGFYVSGFMANKLENGAQTLLLVDSFTGALGDDLDTNDDGELDSQPWTRIDDAVGVLDADGGLTYAGAPVLPLDLPVLQTGPVTVGGASRIPDGMDTNRVADWYRNDFSGTELPCCSLTASAVSGAAVNTPGAPNVLMP